MKFFWNLEMAYSQATFVKKKSPSKILGQQTANHVLLLFIQNFSLFLIG